MTVFQLPDAFEVHDREHFDAGVAAFRAEDFYQAHDEWEEVWQGYRGADRRFLQALIHVAVGAYHAQCGNPKGALSQFDKAHNKMEPFLPEHWGIDGTRLLTCARQVGELVKNGEAVAAAIGVLSDAL